MTIRNTRTGESVEARLTTDSAASSYGQPVLEMPGGLVLGPGDMVDLEISALSPEELPDVARWMYGVTPDLIALATGNVTRTVQLWCQKLGILKQGRDYRLGPPEIARILERMQPTVGRPPSA